jgi:outer membrane protein
VESNRVNKFQAQGAFLPTLNGSGSFSNNYGRNLNPVTYTYYQGITTTINPSLFSQLTLFNGFKLQNQLKQTSRNLAAADLDLEKSKNDVIINVVTYYTNVILNKELYENAKVQLNSSEQTLDRIKKQVQAGALPKSNELNQEAVVATNETNLINQENAYNYSLLQLKQSMQVPSSTQVEVVVPDISMQDLVLDQTPEDIYKISAQTLPQVKSAMLKVQSAEFALKAARASFYPRITVNASATSNYNSASDKARSSLDGGFKQQQIGIVGTTGDPVYTQVPTQSVFAPNYGVGDQIGDNLYKNLAVSISIPILNGFQARTGVQQAVITQELANITVKETENTLRQAIETAYNNALAAAKSYTAAVKQVSANEEAFRMTTQRYENGAANYVEFQVSSNDLFSAKSSLARAKYNFIFTKKVLDFYQGKPLEY